MRKKLLTLLLAVAASIGTMFAEPVQIGDLYYNLDATNQTAEVTYELQYSENNYKGLTTANIPSSVTYNSVSYSVTSIGYQAFYKCIGLTSVTIPNSVTSIGTNAFYDCTGLTSVIWNAKNCADFVSNNTFYDSRSQITSFTFGNEVEHIPAYLCNGMSNLTSIEIPNSVTSIGYEAFLGCSSLTSVNITDIAAWCNIAFSSYSSNPLYYAKHLYVNNVEVTNLVIPEGVTSIGYEAFFGCTGLNSVTIPNSVTSIGSYAFQYCSGLTSVTIGNSVTSIGYAAFSGCSSLTSVNITDIAAWCNIAFSFYYSNPLYCAKHLYIYDVEVTNLVIPEGVTSIGEYAFVECTGLTSVTIPNSVTSIGSSAFAFCSGLTSVTIPNSVTSIGEYAFVECTGLTSVTIPNSVTSIGSSAFSGCSGLTSVTIPNSVTSIGGRAFDGCTGLTSVTCLATTPPMMGSNVFYNVNCSKIPLYVPDESIEDYKAAEQWNLFSPILPLSQKPQESEAIDEIIVEDLTSSTKKILHNGQIYILRGDKTYTTDGRLVR